MRLRHVLALISLAVAGVATAAPVKYQLNSDHSQVVFTISHFGFSKTHGSFRKISGTLLLDEQKLEDSKVDVIIDAKSVDTDLGARDGDVMASDFLDAYKYPTIKFVSTKVTKIDAKTLKVTGDMTLRGQTKPVTFTAKLNKSAPNPFDKVQNVGFSGSGSLKRSDFGMTAMAPDIGDQVDFAIDVECVQAK